MCGVQLYNEKNINLFKVTDTKYDLIMYRQESHNVYYQRFHSQGTNCPSICILWHLFGVEKFSSEHTVNISVVPDKQQTHTAVGTWPIILHLPVCMVTA